MKANHKTPLDFQSHWEKLVDKGLTDLDSLTRDERIWFTVQSLIGQVDDGGLISHYYNSGADHNQETIEDLTTLGFPEIANLLLQLNALFPNGHPSNDIDERNAVIENWPEGGYEVLLEQLDQLFYEKEQELEERLITHIETRVLAIR